ncbi:hypothetical protein GW17_00052338 [Ensete ventricosum]|nr:hypothetical protein GW17_00052338 [Ensete ventricosum]
MAVVPACTLPARPRRSRVDREPSLPSPPAGRPQDVTALAARGRGLAFRGTVNLLRERHHEDKQAKKNAYSTKVGMAEFELRLDT